jgi:ABC-type lipoprotein release transport system permease subunit
MEQRTQTRRRRRRQHRRDSRTCHQERLTLRTGQSLHGYGTAVNVIQVKLIDIYNADSVADRIMALVPYEAKSWTREFPQFLSSLQ